MSAMPEPKKRWKKFTSQQRYNLTGVIMGHALVTSYVREGTELYGLSQRKLIELAEKLGIDVAQAIAIDRPFFKHDKYAFKGHALFDIEFVVFGEVVKRQARAEFEYTPEWAYFDPSTGTEKLAAGASTVSIDVLAEPEVESTEYDDGGNLVERPAEPYWVDFDVLRLGILPNEIHERIYDLIDHHCKAIDDGRRKGIVTN